MIRSIALILLLSTIGHAPLYAQTSEGGGAAQELISQTVTSRVPTLGEALRSAIGKDEAHKGEKLLLWLRHRAELYIKITIR